MSDDKPPFVIHNNSQNDKSKDRNDEIDYNHPNNWPKEFINAGIIPKSGGILKNQAKAAGEVAQDKRVRFNDQLNPEEFSKEKKTGPDVPPRTPELTERLKQADQEMMINSKPDVPPRTPELTERLKQADQEMMINSTPHESHVKLEDKNSTVTTSYNSGSNNFKDIRKMFEQNSTPSNSKPPILKKPVGLKR